MHKHIGERQADLAGKRPQEYGYTYNRLVSSSMTQAKDIARIIKETINAIRTVETDLLTEGAPIKPVDGWNPDIDVSFRTGKPEQSYSIYHGPGLNRFKIDIFFIYIRFFFLIYCRSNKSKDQL